MQAIYKKHNRLIYKPLIIKDVVKLEKNKIIIEIETCCPADDFQELQREIIRVIQQYNYADYGSYNGCPFLRIMALLEAMLPNDEFYNNLLNRKN